MNQRLLAEIGRTQRLEILNSLKRSKGMSVNELVAKMKMSYMGIKQHCLTLQRDGYLDTWRRPQKMGRPEMVYRLTRRTHDLFATDSNKLRSTCSNRSRKFMERMGRKNSSTMFSKEKHRLSKPRSKAKRSATARNGWPKCGTTRVIWRNS